MMSVTVLGMWTGVGTGTGTGIGIGIGMATWTEMEVERETEATTLATAVTTLTDSESANHTAAMTLRPGRPVKLRFLPDPVLREPSRTMLQPRTSAPLPSFRARNVLATLGAAASGSYGDGTGFSVTGGT